MSWANVIGQRRAKTILQQTVVQHRIAHAYLFSGPDGIGKEALALEFAKCLCCVSGTQEACDKCPSCRKFEVLQHPNVNLIFALPVGKTEKKGDDPIACLSEDQVASIRTEIQTKALDSYYHIQVPKANYIKINSVREIKRESSMTSIETGKKIFVILGAEMMNDEAGNSLLKTLEEPLPGTILLLTSSEKDRLLPTIVSRCQTIKCDLLSEDEIVQALMQRDKIEREQAQIVARLANGSYGLARRLLASNMAEQREEVIDFVRLALSKQRSSVLHAIEEIVSTYDRVSIQRWIEVLQIWLREALLLQKTGKDTGLAGDIQSLYRFIERFPQANIIGALDRTESAIAQIDKNVYLSLVLINLAIGLRDHLTEKYML